MEFRSPLRRRHEVTFRDLAAKGLLPDGTFVTTTYGHWSWGEEPYVVSVRFRLDELDLRALS